MKGWESMSKEKEGREKKKETTHMFPGWFFWTLSIYPLMILMIFSSVCSRTMFSQLWPTSFFFPPFQFVLLSAFWKRFVEVGRVCLDWGLALWRPLSGVGAAWLAGTRTSAIASALSVSSRFSNSLTWRKQSRPRRPPWASQQCRCHVFILSWEGQRCAWGSRARATEPRGSFWSWESAV